MIGSGFEASRHVDKTGHPVKELSQEMSDAVGVLQRKHSPWPDAADWIAYAQFKQRAGRAAERLYPKDCP